MSKYETKSRFSPKLMLFIKTSYGHLERDMTNPRKFLRKTPGVFRSRLKNEWKSTRFAETTFRKKFPGTRKLQFWHPSKWLRQRDEISSLTVQNWQQNFPKNLFFVKMSILTRKIKFWHPYRKNNYNRLPTFRPKARNDRKKTFFWKSFTSKFSFVYLLCIFDKLAEMFPSRCGNCLVEIPRRLGKDIFFQKKGTFFLEIFHKGHRKHFCWSQLIFLDKGQTFSFKVRRWEK